MIFPKGKRGLTQPVYRVRDLWTKKDLGTTEETLNAELPGHDVLMLSLLTTNSNFGRTESGQKVVH